MDSSKQISQGKHLPVAGRLTLHYISSLLIAALVVAASVAGLVFPSRVYPTQELLESALPNDVINLALGVPILFASMWLARRNELVGLLVWPGALLFVVYNALARTIDLPVGWLLAANLALLSLSVYTLIALVASLDSASVLHRLSGSVYARFTGAVLIALGTLFILRAVAVFGAAAVGGAALPDTEVSVLLADVVLGPAWAIGGVLLWQRRPLGYTGGVGLLFQGSMLFVGAIAFVLLQPVLTEAPFDLEAVIVLSAMALPCWIPFGLIVRGIARSKS